MTTFGTYDFEKGKISSISSSMKGAEVIENGDILIENNQIKAVGAGGSLEAGNAQELDVSGKTIVPGFIDTHATALDRGLDFGCTISSLWNRPKTC